MAVDNSRLPMTYQGYQRLMEDLKRLKSVERPKIVQEIDLSLENKKETTYSQNSSVTLLNQLAVFVSGDGRAMKAKLAPYRRDMEKCWGKRLRTSAERNNYSRLVGIVYAQ